MTSIEPQFRESVRRARSRLQRDREKLRRQHAEGSPGVQLCALVADLMDAVVLDLFQEALRECNLDQDGQISLVPHGGYGRRDVAPFSDVDLLVLHPTDLSDNHRRFLKRFHEDLCDTGLRLGFSSSHVRDACLLARQNPATFTSFAEARLLAGSISRFRRFQDQLRRDARRRSRKLMAQIDGERRSERRQYGETVYLLEPNVKRSRGGLRDVQLIRWIGMARYGEPGLDALHRRGLLEKPDYRKLKRALEFLLRLRNELHFHSGKPQDVLGKDEQLRISELWEYAGDEGLRPVERFMRDYFEHTSLIRHTSAHFLASARSETRVPACFRSLMSHRLEGDFLVGQFHIGTTRRGRQKVCSELEQVLRLMDLSNRTGKRIDHATWEAVRSAMTDHEVAELSSQAATRFLSLLSASGRLENLLRRLHELRVLEQIVPAMRHARCLVQFNEYHKYTVDEHSIRAVGQVSELAKQGGEVGRAYARLRDKSLLHLALLMHDLGKGHPDDHSEVGERLAAETAQRLRLGRRDSDMLQRLVLKHLRMAHLAFQHDLDDPGIPVQLAHDVQSMHGLDLLFLLTCADVAAVGPGTLNSWKLDLLTALYRRTRRLLAGEEAGHGADEDHRREERGQHVREAAAEQGHPVDSWWNRQIRELPTGYLFGERPDLIAKDLQYARHVERHGAQCWSRYLGDKEVLMLAVAALDGGEPGLFHRLTGALTSRGLEIHAAQIYTLSDGLLLDRFFVTDPDFAGEPPPERIEEIRETLLRAVRERNANFVFRQTWQPQTEQRARTLSALPTVVRFDNQTSDRCTIVNVLAYDRRGLLYSVARALVDAGLSIDFAKIGTYLDQVVDVFYVTDVETGEKITDEQRLSRIRESLLAAVDHVPTQTASTS